jgi:cellobiose-specific phosphotransferase system component IIB
MFKRQAKEKKIRRILKKVNIDKLKIVILKNGSKKTHFEVKNQILFVNPQVKFILDQVLKELSKKSI